MKTKNPTALRSALLWASTVGAASCLTLAAFAQTNDTAPQPVPSTPPPPDAITPGSGGQSYNVTPVSTESIGTQEARYSGTASAPITTTTTAQVGVLDATSPVDRPGMSPGQYGVAIALHLMAITRTPDQVLAADELAREFRHAPYESHAAFGVYGLRIDAAASSLDNLQSRAVQFSGDTQIPFRTAANNVRECRADLNQCLTAAQNATPDSWDQARRALADSYVRYSQAVTQATAAASR